jgi:hypothetical protein
MMNKKDAISIIKRKIKESEDAAKEKHFGTLTQTAISSYESGRAQGLKDALAIIGMIEDVQVLTKKLWHEANGDYLPKVDREVIVLCKNNKVCYGHRPNFKGWDGKNIITGEVRHYTPQTYGKGEWNIPDVRWWLDCSLPNLEEEK